MKSPSLLKTLLEADTPISGEAGLALFSDLLAASPKAAALTMIGVVNKPDRVIRAVMTDSEGWPVEVGFSYGTQSRPTLRFNKLFTRAGSVGYDRELLDDVGYKLTITKK